MKRKTIRHELTIEERKRLLGKPSWSLSDVMLYTGYAKSKASSLIGECKAKLNGAVIFEPHKVKRNSVLTYCGTSLEQELYCIKQLEKVDT